MEEVAIINHRENLDGFFSTNGFTTTENGWTLEQTIKTGEMVVNGQRVEQTRKQLIEIIYLGEGSIDETMTYGIKIKQNGEDTGDFWMDCIEDLTKYIFR